MFRSWTLWRAVVATCQQPGGAPIVDFGTTVCAEDARQWSSVIVLLRGWRRRKWDRPGGRALVFGWQTRGADDAEEQ